MSFIGQHFIGHDSTAPVTPDAILGHKVIAIYFSAHWCPPCRGFTPILAEFYKEVKKSSPEDLEIIFVTSDQSAESMADYFKTMPWKAIPFGDPIIAQLKQKFQVSGIPCLVVCKPDGTLITKDGRGDVTHKGAAACKEWVSKA